MDNPPKRQPGGNQNIMFFSSNQMKKQVIFQEKGEQTEENSAERQPIPSGLLEEQTEEDNLEGLGEQQNHNLAEEERCFDVLKENVGSIEDLTQQQLQSSSGQLQYNQQQQQFLLETSSDTFNLTGFKMGDTIPFDSNSDFFAAQNSLKSILPSFRIAPQQSIGNNSTSNYYACSKPLQPLKFGRSTKTNLFNKSNNLNSNIKTSEKKNEIDRGLFSDNDSILDEPFIQDQHRMGQLAFPSMSRLYSNYNGLRIDSLNNSGMNIECLNSNEKPNNINDNVVFCSSLVSNHRQNTPSLAQYSEQFPFSLAAADHPYLVFGNIGSLKQFCSLAESNDTKKSLDMEKLLTEGEQKHSTDGSSPLGEVKVEHENGQEEQEEQTNGQEDSSMNQKNQDQKQARSQKQINTKRKSNKKQQPCEKLTNKRRQLEPADCSNFQAHSEETRLPNEEEDLSKVVIDPKSIENNHETQQESQQVTPLELLPEAATIEQPQQKQPGARSSRQSQHKNVYKNFGKELLRFVRSQRDSCDVLTDDEFSQMIDLLTGGLNDKDTKQTLPIQKKEQLQKLWEIREEEINNKIKNSSHRNETEDEKFFDLNQLIGPEQDQIREEDTSEQKIKKLFRTLAWKFFDNYAFLYVMTSRKLDKKLIHLKCIRSFLVGILCPKSLEQFKPIREF